MHLCGLNGALAALCAIEMHRLAPGEAAIMAVPFEPFQIECLKRFRSHPCVNAIRPIYSVSSVLWIHQPLA